MKKITEQSIREECANNKKILIGEMSKKFNDQTTELALVAIAQMDEALDRCEIAMIENLRRHEIQGNSYYE